VSNSFEQYKTYPSANVHNPAMIQKVFDRLYSHQDTIAFDFNSLESTLETSNTFKNNNGENDVNRVNDRKEVRFQDDGTHQKHLVQQILMDASLCADENRDVLNHLKIKYPRVKTLEFLQTLPINRYDVLEAILKLLRMLHLSKSCKDEDMQEVIDVIDDYYSDTWSDLKYLIRKTVYNDIEMLRFLNEYFKMCYHIINLGYQNLKQADLAVLSINVLEMISDFDILAKPHEFDFWENDPFYVYIYADNAQLVKNMHDRDLFVEAYQKDLVITILCQIKY